jgi:hypothetical protein
MEKGDMMSTAANKTRDTNTNILQSDVKDVAVSFWKYLNKDRNSSFLDADVKDVAKEVLNFLNKDVVGQKVVLLEDEKLRTANVIARALKRKRSIVKTNDEKSTVAQIKKVYKYLKNPFWENSSMVGRSRKYLDDHLRKMTPAIMHGLIANVKKLRAYFSGVVLDESILAADSKLEQLAIIFGYQKFGVCEKHQQPLAKHETGDILCNYTDCSTGKCPFEANKAIGEEIDFLSGLEELFEEMGIITKEEN